MIHGCRANPQLAAASSLCNPRPYIPASYLGAMESRIPSSLPFLTAHPCNQGWLPIAASHTAIDWPRLLRCNAPQSANPQHHGISVAGRRRPRTFSTPRRDSCLSASYRITRSAQCIVVLALHWAHNRHRLLWTAPDLQNQLELYAKHPNCQKPRRWSCLHGGGIGSILLPWHPPTQRYLSVIMVSLC